MENATKALLIAAGVLIGMIILSMGVYLFSGISSYMSETQEIIENNAINKFNTQFFNYQTEENEELSFQDVITVANIAYDNNFENELTGDSYIGDGTTNYVQVTIKGYISPKTGEETSATYESLERVVGDPELLSEWLQYNYSSKYICNKIDVSTESKRVYKITFEKI